MKENIEEDIKIVEKLIKTMEQDRITFKDEQTKEIYAYFITALEHILSDYKRIQEEFKQVDHECFRLEQKEVRLEKEIEEWQRAYQKEKDEQFELLRENQELQKENEKLERANKCYINSIQSIAPVLLQDYISKQKIKDKIEELNKKEQELQNSISDEEREEYSDTSISFDLMDIHIRREELQDLLEEKGE